MASDLSPADQINQMLQAAKQNEIKLPEINAHPLLPVEKLTTKEVILHGFINLAFQVAGAFLTGFVQKKALERK